MKRSRRWATRSRAGLAEMDGQSGEQLLRARREKFLAMGRNLYKAKGPR